MRHLLVLLAVLWCAPAWALNLPDPMPDHPRLLINQAMIDSAQSRIAVVGSDHARIYAAAKTYADLNHLTKTTGSGGADFDDTETFAWIYLLSGSSAYGAKAVDVAMWTARHGYEQANPSNYYAWGNVSGLALTYDWCHDLFTPAQLDTLQGVLAKAAVFPLTQTDWWSYWSQEPGLTAIALVGDSTSYYDYFGATTYTDSTIAVEADCLHNWLGAGTVCDPDPCPLPDDYGACCHVDGTCTYLPASACDNWWGPDVLCEPNPCPCPCWED